MNVETGQIKTVDGGEEGMPWLGHGRLPCMARMVFGGKGNKFSLSRFGVTEHA